MILNRNPVNPRRRFLNSSRCPSLRPTSTPSLWECRCWIRPTRWSRTWYSDGNRQRIGHSHYPSASPTP